MSPFMTGLLLGMTLFSALSQQWALQELTALQERQAADARRSADELADGMRFAVMTETADTYDETFALQRARQFSEATGVTRGGAEVLTTVRQATGEGAFGTERTQVALTASDDVLLRSQLNRSGDGSDLAEMAGGKAPVALVDVQGLRAEQVLTSQQRMEVVAEQLYTYYAARMKFPDGAAFTSMSGALGLRDAWGQNFRYEPAPDQQSGVLSFTTPWGHEQKLTVSLRDDTIRQQGE